MAHGLGISLGVGGGKPATSGGTPPPAAGFPNVYSMDFLGEDEYIATGDLDDMEGIGEITISFWMNMDVDGNVAWAGGSSSSGLFFQSYPIGASRNLYFGVGGGDDYVTLGNGSPSTGAWHHVCCIYDGLTASPRAVVYVDGISTLITARTLPATANSSSAGTAFKIGRWSAGGYVWNGKIDELAMWNEALTSGNVATIVNASAASGSKAIDLDAQSFAKPDHWWRMGDGATWDGSNWTIPDVGNAVAPGDGGNPGTSVNMLLAARVDGVGNVP